MANPRIPIGIPALLVSAFVSASAAQAAPSAADGLGKTEAILGGQSRLAAILAEQGAAPPSPAARPSGYRLNRSSAVARALPVRTSPAATSGKPDVFGSVALRVARTSLDSKWRRVAGARLTGRAALLAGSLHKTDKQTRIEAINRYVNARVQFVDDVRQYGRADVWKTANETLNRGRGDCEDYAIAKLQMLRAAGFSDRDLYLVILKDLVRRSDHAVAVVRSGDRMFVLDNGTDEILENEAVTDYRPILTFAAHGAWTHGYKVRSAPVEVASAQSSLPALAPAAQ